MMSRSSPDFPAETGQVSRRAVLQGGLAATALLTVGGRVVGPGWTADAAADPTPSSVPADSDGEWPAYGRDAGGMRHSPLTQINRENVAGSDRRLDLPHR